jgi:type III pantothenate kinase
MAKRRLLADIGNSHMHIYDGVSVEHLPHREAIAKYAQDTLSYISVRHALESELAALSNWQNISKYFVLPGEYETMGVDRKALCMSHPDGLFVDAGSAITVDLMRGDHYQGGFILPGLSAAQRAYAKISPVLDVSVNLQVPLERLPHTTRDGISYGIIAPIKAIIEQHQEGVAIYCSGGDGAFLSTLFEDAIYDETLLFQGMMKVLDKLDKDD